MSDNLTYPEKHERIVTADGVQQRLTAEIERLNRALDSGLERERQLHHEAEKQRAHAAVAFPTLHVGNEAVAGKERRIREAHVALISLVECAAAQPVWCDSVRGCVFCGGTGDDGHKPGCPVRLAMEWIG